MKTLGAFIRENRVRMVCAYADSNPSMPEWRDARHFLVTLKVGRRSMRLHFSQGSGHTAEPTAADVLDCLASDASSVNSARDFEDWASDLGYDVDSRKAHATFEACQKQAEQLSNC